MKSLPIIIFLLLGSQALAKKCDNYTYGKDKKQDLKPSQKRVLDMCLEKYGSKEVSRSFRKATEKHEEKIAAEEAKKLAELNERRQQAIANRAKAEEEKKKIAEYKAKRISTMVLNSNLDEEVSTALGVSSNDDANIIAGRLLQKLNKNGPHIKFDVVKQAEKICNALGYEKPSEVVIMSDNAQAVRKGNFGSDVLTLDKKGMKKIQLKIDTEDDLDDNDVTNSYALFYDRISCVARGVLEDKLEDVKTKYLIKYANGEEKEFSPSSKFAGTDITRETVSGRIVEVKFKSHQKEDVVNPEEDEDVANNEDDVSGLSVEDNVNRMMRMSGENRRRHNSVRGM